LTEPSSNTGDDAAHLDDSDTSEFYSANRWPGPNAIVSKKWAERLAPYLPDGPLELLDAGCGSGQYLAGMLAEYPDMNGVGIDISAPSIGDAAALVEGTGVGARAEVLVKSFSDPLDWDQRFDVAISNGAIHHSPDPARSMQNIARSIKPKGLFGCMIYGSRSNHRRYEIKEMLHLLADGDLDLMYDLHRDFQSKYESVWDATPRQMMAALKGKLGRLAARLRGREAYLGYDPTADHKKIFIDGFGTPIDAGFDTSQVRAMLENAGLELVKMIGSGRPDPALLPPTWQAPWQQLPPWTQMRIIELLDPNPSAFSFVARKID